MVVSAFLMLGMGVVGMAVATSCGLFAIVLIMHVMGVVMTTAMVVMLVV